MTPAHSFRFAAIVEHYGLPKTCVHELELLIRDVENRVHDGFAETRAQLDELAQQAEGSHRQHMGKRDVS